MDKTELIINALAVLLGDYAIYRKKASLLILKCFLSEKELTAILSDSAVYPFDRNDIRVTRWKKQVLAAKKCAFCGSAENLEAHHVIGWAEWPQGRVDVENGLCLCHACHTQEHKGNPAYYLMLAKRTSGHG